MNDIYIYIFGEPKVYNRSDELQHYGVLGMKWGKRRAIRLSNKRDKFISKKKALKNMSDGDLLAKRVGNMGIGVLKNGVQNYGIKTLTGLAGLGAIAATGGAATPLASTIAIGANATGSAIALANTGRNAYKGYKKLNKTNKEYLNDLYDNRIKTTTAKINKINNKYKTNRSNSDRITLQNAKYDKKEASKLDSRRKSAGVSKQMHDEAYKIVVKRIEKDMKNSVNNYDKKSGRLWIKGEISRFYNGGPNNKYIKNAKNPKELADLMMDNGNLYEGDMQVSAYTYNKYNHK